MGPVPYSAAYLQGSRKLDQWDPMGLDKIYLVSSLDKPTADWTNCPADGANFLEDRKKNSKIINNFFSSSVYEVK